MQLLNEPPSTIKAYFIKTFDKVSHRHLLGFHENTLNWICDFNFLLAEISGVQIQNPGECRQRTLQEELFLFVHVPSRMCQLLDPTQMTW